MPLQPIDLQTLFTQLDKVGKDQSVHKEGVQIQASVQGAQIQKKADVRAHSVNEAQAAGDGPERIKDRNGRRQRSRQFSTTGENTEGDFDDSDRRSAAPPPGIISDPDLGRNLDVSG
ncbi:hypothetical protein FACS1894130_09760 [Spirochaetia bacterium]|nr:hypothetical protein FACS1894130_09760 [Spirochaetia bacterium]